jgi:HEAT repeat protein/Na+/melibiose symporter-like transporter
MDALKNLQISNVDIAFASAFGSLIGGSILIGFIQHLGGKDLWISLAAAIPALAGLVQIPGAIWGRSFTSYKRFLNWGAIGWRFFYLPFLILPIIPWAPEVRLFLVMLCIGLASFSVSVIGPLYNDWIAEMIPAASRGAFYAKRILIGTVSGAVTGLFGGMALDYFESIKQQALGFSVIFGVAWILGIVSMVIFSRMTDSPRLNPTPANFREGMRQLLSPAKDKNFTLILIFVCVFAVSQGFAGQYFTAYSREVLNLPFTFIQLLGISHTISTVLFVKAFGFLTDRYGNKPILVLLVAGTALTPLQWVVISPDNLGFGVPFLLITHLFNGFVWSGIGVAQFNLYITTSDVDDRPNYLAAATALSALAMGVSPMLGYVCMEFFRVQFSTAEWAYKWLFMSLIVIRLAALFLLIAVKEPGAQSLRKAVSQLSKLRPKGVRALRQISSSEDETARELAVAQVGDSRMEMGREELLKALEDPSPKVRRQAARALGQIGSPEVARALADHLERQPHLADEEALEALGYCASEESIPVLSRFLRDPRAFLRRAAARGLGDTGLASAIDPLLEAAAEAGDPDLRRASLQALRQLEAANAAGVFGDALWDQHPSVRNAAAEGISEMQLSELAPTLRESIKWFGDETASEMAYALGAVGDSNDLSVILYTAQDMVSRPLRRRCLMGAARLLEVEGAFYRLVSLEGSDRDQELMKLLRPGTKIHPEWIEALDRYSQEEHQAAVSLLFSASDHPARTSLVESPVDEVFLIAALVAVREMETSERE